MDVGISEVERGGVGLNSFGEIEIECCRICTLPCANRSRYFADFRTQYLTC